VFLRLPYQNKKKKKRNKTPNKQPVPVYLAWGPPELLGLFYLVIGCTPCYLQYSKYPLARQLVIVSFGLGQINWVVSPSFMVPGFSRLGTRGVLAIVAMHDFPDGTYCANIRQSHVEGPQFWGTV